MGQHGKHRPLVIWRAALFATLALISGRADADTCRLALVLAIDVSSSVDAQEDQLQRQGLATALLQDTVQAAILEGYGTVAINVFEWSGRRQQFGILPWTVLRSTKDIQDAADAISGSTRQVSVFPTSTGYALGHAAILLDRGPVCDAKTIDFASDGRNNDGFPPELAIRSFPLSDVTINGLAILGDAPDLVTYFERSILHGPGAFVEIANDYPDYARAMDRKLLRELGTFVLGDALPPPTLTP